MPGQDENVVTKIEVQGAAQALADIKSLRDALAGLNAGGGASGMSSAASPVAPTAPGAPAAPAPPSVPPVFQRPYDPYVSPPAQVTSAQTGVSYSLAPGYGGNRSSSPMPSAPAPPGVPGSTAHAGTPPPNPAGWPSGTSAWASPAPSGGGASATPPPPSPAPPGSGGGVPPVPAPGGEQEGGWGRFFRNLQKNPTFGGMYSAAMNELPIGGAAAITGSMAVAAWYGHAALAEQRPGFENRLAQESAALRGQYVPMALRAGASRAADIHGAMGYDRAILSPLNAVSFGLVGTVYDMTTGMRREEEATRAESEAQTSQNLLQLGALSGVSQAELRRRFGTRQRVESDLGFWGNTRRDIGKGIRGSSGISGFFGGAFDAATLGFFGNAANAGVTDEFQFNEDDARYVPSMSAARRMSMGLGSDGNAKMFTDPKAFQKAFGKAIDNFGDQATLQSLGLVAHGMTNDPSQMGMYRRGGGIEDFGNAQIAARVAAGRGQDISGFVPSFYQNSAMKQFTGLEDTRRSVLEAQGAGQRAGYEGSIAASKMQAMSMTGANFPEMQQQLLQEAAAMRKQLAALQAQLALAPTETDRLRLQAEAQGLTAHLAGVPRQYAEMGYQMRSTGLGAFGMAADTALQRTMYSGGSASDLDRAFTQQGSGVLGNAALLREKARRADLYDPQTRAMFNAQAEQQEFHARVMLPRQASQTRFGLDAADAGLAGAEAGAAMSRARLFGGPADYANAVRGEQKQTALELAAVTNLLSRGNLSLEEIKRYQSEQTRLQTKQVELAQEEKRGQAQQEYSNSQGRLGIASTEQRTAFLQGIGGREGAQLTFGLIGKAGVVTQKAQAQVDLLRQQGVSEDNPTMLQARQELASAREQEVSLGQSIAHVPMGVGDSRAMSAARYQADILQTVPGSYGNLRGAYRKQMQLLEKRAQEVLGIRAQARQQAGGKLSEDVEAQFQYELETLGRTQAGVAQNLAHGWESRMVSQVLGAPGNFSFVARNYSLRDAVGAGIQNSHFGSNARDLPFYLQDEARWGGGASLAGATGTPAGFNATALSGIAPINKFGGVSGQSGMVNPMAGMQSEGMITVKVIVANEDGRVLKREVTRMTPQRLGLNASEDLQNNLILGNQGQ